MLLIETEYFFFQLVHQADSKILFTKLVFSAFSQVRDEKDENEMELMNEL